MLTLAGALVGALVMTKINVGLFAVAAIVVAFVVGNDQYPKRFRTVVAAGGVVLPFALMVQKLWEVERAEFALLVALVLLLSYVPMQLDVVSLPRRGLWVMARAAVVVMVVSVIWPLANGTSPTAVVTGVLIRATRQAGILESIPPIDFDWIAFIVTIGVVGVVLASRVRGRPRISGPRGSRPVRSVWPGSTCSGWARCRGCCVSRPGSWPGSPRSRCCRPSRGSRPAPPKFRLVFRLLVPLAILQMLHAYPVAGSQLGWGMVAMCVPCVLAMAFAAKRVPGGGTRAVRCTARDRRPCALLLLGAALSPIKVWHDYMQLTPLDLRGARLGAARQGEGHDAPGPDRIGAPAVRHLLFGARPRQPLHLYGPACAHRPALELARCAHDRRAAPSSASSLRRARERRASLHLCAIRSGCTCGLASRTEEGRWGKTIALLQAPSGPGRAVHRVGLRPTRCQAVSPACVRRRRPSTGRATARR